jgi:hypothetical protein
MITSEATTQSECDTNGDDFPADVVVERDRFNGSLEWPYSDPMIFRSATF